MATIYSRKNADTGKNELYVRNGNSTTTVTYKDADGDSLTLTAGDRYNCFPGGLIKRASDDKFVNLIGANGEVLIGHLHNTQTNKIENIKLTMTKQKSFTTGDKIGESNAVIKVVATYTDGHTENVTSEATFSPLLTAELATTDTTLTATYKQKTSSVAITVSEA